MKPLKQRGLPPLWQREGSRLGRVADAESEFIEMTDSTRLCASIYGVKTAKTKSRGNVVKGFALIAWMALATTEAQNLAPPTPASAERRAPHGPMPPAGGGSYTSYSLDPATHELFGSVANPYPDYDAARLGDNLYTNCVISLNPNNGR